MISYLETREKTQCAALMARSHANNVELIPLQPGCWRASLGASKQWKGKPDLLSVISSHRIFRLHISKFQQIHPFADGSPEVQQKVHAAFILSHFFLWHPCFIQIFQSWCNLNLKWFLNLTWSPFVYIHSAGFSGRRLSHTEGCQQAIISTMKTYEDLYKWQKWIWVTDVTTEIDIIQRTRN